MNRSYEHDADSLPHQLFGTEADKLIDGVIAAYAKKERV